MKLQFAIAIAGIVLLCSCDPMRRLEIQNQSHAAATIIWNLKEDSALHSPLFISNATEVKFNLPPHRPHNKLNMSYGMGSWTVNELKALADDIVSLEIITARQHLKYENTNDLISYLRTHRKGIGNRKIVLVLE